jgi:hypothetical protein
MMPTLLAASDQEVMYLFIAVVVFSVIIAFGVLAWIRHDYGVVRVKCKCGFQNRPVHERCWNCGRPLR